MKRATCVGLSHVSVLKRSHADPRRSPHTDSTADMRSQAAVVDILRSVAECGRVGTENILDAAWAEINPIAAP
jgi:hypothetical protein